MSRYVCVTSRVGEGAGLVCVSMCLRSVCAVLVSGLEAGTPRGGHFTVSSETHPLLEATCFLTLSVSPAGPEHTGSRLGGEA